MGHAIGSLRRGFEIGAKLEDWEGAEIDRFRRRPRGQRVGQDETLDFGLREDLMSEARDLCNKQGLGNRIIRQYANYVVGDCQARWTTPDADWNKLAEQAFYDWSLNCDLRSSVTLKEKAKLHIMTLIRDGDSFAVKVDFFGDPKLKDIEPDQVGNYKGGTRNIDEDRIVGGIKFDIYDRPQSYLIWERTRFGNFKNVDVRPASEVLHIYDSTRLNARRGVTHFASVLNHQRDLKETVAAQKAKQKLISKLALMVRNALGGPQTGNIEIMNEDVDRATGATIRTESFGEGGAIKYQFVGDEMQAFQANDPSDGWFKLTDYLIREIALGLDLPYEFVWTMAGITGPGTRMMSKQAERTFRGKQDILENRFLNPITSWWVNYEMQPGGKLPFNPEWYKFKFQRPAHISIDAGRDSKANLDELGAGVSTEGRIAEEQGEDDEEVAETRAMEVRRKLVNARKISDEFQISLTEALNLIGRSHVPTSQTITTDDLDKVNAPVHNPIPTVPGEARAVNHNVNIDLAVREKRGQRSLVMHRRPDGQLVGVLKES